MPAGDERPYAIGECGDFGHGPIGDEAVQERRGERIPRTYRIGDVDRVPGGLDVFLAAQHRAPARAQA